MLASLPAWVEHIGITELAEDAMRSNRFAAICLALTFLVACDKEATPPAAPPALPKPPAVPAAQQKPVNEPAEPKQEREPKPAPPPPKPASPAPGPIRPKAAPASVTAHMEEPEVKLDLSLPDDLAKQLEPGDVLDDLPSMSLLPQMFVEKPAPSSPFRLNGKLITNEREDEYWRSVEGAEVQFEFKR